MMRFFRENSGSRGTRVVGVLGLMGLAFAAGVGIAADSEDDALMRSKLVHAQTILEGLALEDYAKIRSASDELILISRTAQWEKGQSPRYAQLASEFRAATERTARMAENQNLDGATLGFLQATMSCVECHQLVRGKDKVADESR